MSAALQAWVAWHRARRRISARRRPPREDLVRRWAPGRSFVDVGAMWAVDGAIAFTAAAAGATRVTTVDLMEATPAFVAERERRGSAVRHVTGDLHDPATRAAAGVHDVVWCSGVLYHAPDPLHTLRCLRELCGEILLLATEGLPELPGVRGAGLFYPGLDARRRRALRGITKGRALGITEPFDPDQGYANWYWGITPSALRGMLAATGFEVESVDSDPFHLTVVARPVPPPER